MGEINLYNKKTEEPLALNTTTNNIGGIEQLQRWLNLPDYQGNSKQPLPKAVAEDITAAKTRFATD